MQAILSTVSSFFFMAIVAISIENAVFFRALGISRLLKLVNDGTVNAFIFGTMLCIVEIISGVLAYFAYGLVQTYVPEFWRAPVVPLVMVVCTVVAFLLILLFCMTVLLKNEEWLNNGRIKEILAALPLAAFNCCVLGVLYITTTQHFTLVQTIGFAVGAAVGYIMAVLVVTEGQRKISNSNVPKAFQGLPVNLIYIGIFALAIYAFTGNMKLS